jgi:hypothetical protein
MPGSKAPSRPRKRVTKTRPRTPAQVGSSSTEPEGHLPVNQAEHDQQSQQHGPPILQELFEGVIPTSPLALALQDAAQRTGWVPAWKEGELKAKRKKAGERSGISRAGHAKIRLSLLRIARDRLTPEQRRQPYAEDSVAALCKEFYKILSLAEEAFARLSPDQRQHPGAEGTINAVYEAFGKVLDSHVGSRSSRLDTLVPLILSAQSEADRQRLRKIGRETIIKDLKLLRKESGVRR